MVESGLISYCVRQARDGNPKDRRLAEAAVCILKLAPQESLPILFFFFVSTKVPLLTIGHVGLVSGLEGCVHRSQLMI